MLAEKLIELERDPARQDHLAKLMDRLMNRAPSLLKTEPDSHNYFNAPPVVGANAMASETRDTPKDDAGQPRPAPSAPDAVVATETTSKRGADAVDTNTGGADATAERSDAAQPATPTKDDDFRIVVRPSRLSF